jgi:hypothetical protein
VGGLIKKDVQQDGMYAEGNIEVPKGAFKKSVIRMSMYVALSAIAIAIAIWLSLYY